MAGTKKPTKGESATRGRRTTTTGARSKSGTASRSKTK